MSDPNEPMDFSRAEPVEAVDGVESAAPMVCAQCGVAIDSEYFQLGAANKALCAACAQAMQRLLATGAGGSWAVALVLGVAAAAVGAGVYYAVLTLFGLELGLLALFIGYGVGRAVRKGAGLKHHWGLRVMAVALTYLSIVATYVPLIYAQVQANDGALLETLTVALTLPLLMALDGEVLSLIIIGIGLWQAYQLSRAPKLDISGPFQLGSGQTQP